MKQLLFGLMALVFVVIAGCSKTETREEPIPETKILKSQPLPISGQYDGWTSGGGMAVCSDPPRHGFPPHQPMYFMGEGKANHCGKSTMRSDYCISMKPHNTADSGMHYHGYVVNGNTVITCNNGDQLFSMFSGSVVMVQEHGVWINHITISRGYFVGGTGRFEGSWGNYSGGSREEIGRGTMSLTTRVLSEFWFTGHIESSGIH